MSSTAIEESEDNNIDTITKDIERVIISQDNKDTDNDCTSCEQKNNIAEGIDSGALMNMSTCASCGKEGNSDDMNTCNKCKAVKYCNAACKKKHRSKHKKACERRAAELHDEKLFKDHPLSEECPICFLPLQHGSQTESFMPCCGKLICAGCVFTMEKSEEGMDVCVFCRAPPPSSYEEGPKRLKKLMDKGNANSFFTLGMAYSNGGSNYVLVAKNYQKANELYLKAGELGCFKAYYALYNSYEKGEGVEVDKKKARHYCELAAMGGDKMARHSLSRLEVDAGNIKRAVAHVIIAARAGDEGALNNVKRGFMKGNVTKDDYESTLRAYYERNKEMKSDARDKAAASLLDRR